ncbi:hypothetical protein HG535_0E01610 [Zygotorulaspora mrakii]|uniref:Transferrin receptor-like dimerisation domain-containing protein n=1 Tax=Zygotorulaspora mrakii TaxID=42260 RepID=A0A7H9B3L4_ZYGMR|nr:uncharacterized protein HG535_0E01610 [Zygotorulaspora mrakii]QLG73077.1 hypothetical protein HG535_0E01610 [Zygotorulaspora mrakii]
MTRQYNSIAGGEVEPFLGDVATETNTNDCNMGRRDSVSSHIERMRSNSIKSIRSTIEIVREHVDKKKFALLIFSSFLLYIGFICVFAPRTSLARDLRRIHSSHLTESEIFRIYLNELADKNLAGQHVRNYTSHPHEIGDKETLEYTVSQLRSMGFEPKLEKYYPWVNKYGNTEVHLFNESDIIFSATMLEDCLREDPTTCRKDNARGYHGYSANGTVEAQYIFGNYGTLEDYKRLLDNEIDIEGKIHIIRYGEMCPGLKVKNAELYGASGVIMYSDSYEDGYITQANGFEAYPKGPARHQSSIERASVGFFSDFLGDPTTPNYASKYPYTERLSPSGRLPSIPSVPLSAKEVAPLLSKLNGRGVNMLPGGNIEGFNYFSGPSSEDIKAKIVNDQKYKIVEMTNVVVDIPGIFSEYDVIIGNSRDSWTSGGAGSPNSGSSILLEIARGMKSLLRQGWKPLRPIKLISWDGGAHGNLGSTEYVEDHSQLLKRNALAYLNLESAITGSEFNSQANPLLHEVIRRAAKATQYKGEDNWTLFDEWDKSSGSRIDPIDGISDCSSFQFNMGIPSAQFQFRNNGKTDAVHQLHSSFDSYTWMETFVDKNYQMHNTLAVLVGMTSLMLSEKEPTVFTMGPYFEGILENYNQLHESLLQAFPKDKEVHNLAEKVSKVLSYLRSVSSSFDTEVLALSQLCTQDFPAWQIYKKFKIYIKLTRINRKLKQIDQFFLTQKGLNGRRSMRHSIFAPNKWRGDKVDVLPGLHEAICERDRPSLLLWLKTLQTQCGNLESLLQ